jgi:hypothetical protein
VYSMLYRLSAERQCLPGILYFALPADSPLIIRIMSCCQNSSSVYLTLHLMFSCMPGQDDLPLAEK